MTALSSYQITRGFLLYPQLCLLSPAKGRLPARGDGILRGQGKSACALASAGWVVGMGCVGKKTKGGNFVPPEQESGGWRGSQGGRKEQGRGRKRPGSTTAIQFPCYLSHCYTPSSLSLPACLPHSWANTASQRSILAD